MGIVGEPGIGKSRLLVEWRQQLQARGGVAYLEGHCLSYGSTTPYLPVLDWLRAHCGITPADGGDTITAKVCGSLQAVGLAPDAGAPVLLHLLGGEAATARVANISPDTLKAHNIRHEYHETEGGHTWINWRLYLRDFTQLLFR